MVNIGSLNIDPAKNPAILDTASWDMSGIVSTLKRLEHNDWKYLLKILTQGNSTICVHVKGIVIYISSAIVHAAVHYVLIRTSDQQLVLLAIASHRFNSIFGEVILVYQSEDCNVGIYPADYDNLHELLRITHSLKGPKAHGTISRLGIGSRNSVMAWPSVYSAMQKGGFAANSIQNSMREICPLDDLSSAMPQQSNHLFGFGEVPPAYTGGTFEGIWTYGVISAMISGYVPTYGADADHLQLRSDPIHMDRIKNILLSARHYTFFTMDISQIADYSTLEYTSTLRALELFESHIPNSVERQDVLGYHRQRFWFNGIRYQFDDAMIGRFVGKYWNALKALEESYQYISSLKNGEAFDFELTIDEVPPAYNTYELVSHDHEILFLIHEARRRGLNITHLAPNFGVEKTTDYRAPDGLIGLSARVSRLHKIAQQYGLILDCHSGDDLSSETRKVFGRATGGNLHYKISPSVGDVFARSLFDWDQDRFKIWWDDTFAFARRCAEEGSSLAISLLGNPKYVRGVAMDPDDFLFKEFKFATPGKRNSEGQLSMRENFYDLPDSFKEIFTVRLEEWIMEVAHDVFGG